MTSNIFQDDPRAKQPRELDVLRAGFVHEKKDELNNDDVEKGTRLNIFGLG